MAEFEVGDKVIVLSSGVPGTIVQSYGKKLENIYNTFAIKSVVDKIPRVFWVSHIEIVHLTEVEKELYETPE